MEYITIKNGTITGHFCGQFLPVGAVEVKDFTGIVGEPVTYYNPDWSRKKNIELIHSGLMSVPKGKLPMTDEAKLADGQITQFEYDQIKQGKIISELNDIDRKSIRSIRAILSGVFTEEDKIFLADMEKKAIELRKELK